ncbi:ribosomal protein S5 domain 2-like protein [Fomitiporia mediterranea MF3/22]|uniref:ribosomal protein S5 domain 2-like protein n=1 Tax=Fomitiporia mediterranea (strain MF3/22) TaxID=694068 RepID=UPI0004407514|nr:ribosomal protein S5 domain 2-like protein [Fomitiporia mediterranea MF3/22]EJD02287.1 ribosomal protein S5 domain 2-like protein [Fomitiporia mediterranea MF3/22]
MASSAFDRRRINGPEESFTPIYASDEEEGEQLGVGPSKGRRGRSASDIRPIFLKTGLISQANGSAYIETEKTKIACAVYGPRQSKTSTYHEKGKLHVEVKFAPFSCAKRRAPMRDAEDRSVSILIQQSLTPAIRLELIPKSSIDIFLFVIENDGIEGCVSAGAIAASTALAHARIDMLGLVVSCAAATMPKEIWLDPTTEEARAARGRLTLACVPALGLVTNVWQTGQMSIDEVEKCIDACQEKCRDIHAVVAQALLESQTG